MTAVMRPERPRKIRALDADDLKVVSALLQDALVPVSDATYLKPEKRFVMVANRFMWESGAAADDLPGDDEEADAEADDEGDARFLDAAAAGHRRTHCGVCFDRVERVRFRGIDMSARHQILNLLAVEPGPGAIDLVFSDGAAIRLEVSGISCHLEDLGEPWPTRWRPDHLLDEDESRR
jgi:hypothetical protein